MALSVVKYTTFYIASCHTPENQRGRAREARGGGKEERKTGRRSARAGEGGREERKEEGGKASVHQEDKKPNN